MNQDYKFGGCRMIAIAVQNKALKLSWIPCILWKHWLFLGSVFTSQPTLPHWTHMSRKFKQKGHGKMYGQLYKHVLVWNASILVRTNIQGQNLYIPGCG